MKKRNISLPEPALQSVQRRLVGGGGGGVAASTALGRAMVHFAVDGAAEVVAAALGGQALQLARQDAGALHVAAAEDVDELSAHCGFQ